MNTRIYMWVEPVSINRKRCSEKIYFNVIIKGDYAFLNNDTEALDEVICGKIMDEIMDFANIDSNWNFASVKATRTQSAPCIKFANSPEKEAEIKEEKKLQKKEENFKKYIQKVVNSKEDIPITGKNIVLGDDGKLNILYPALKINDTIDFSKIWNNLEANIMGKINKGDKITITDDDGNKLFEMTGGSFLNIGFADISVYDKSAGVTADSNMYKKAAALKGGLYVRNNGVLHIGDTDRTFFLEIHTGKLLKAALKLNTSLMEITSQKLLNNGK